MIKKFSEHINEDYFSKLANRKDNGNVRTEFSNTLVRDFLNDVKSGDYHFVNVNGIDILSESILVATQDIIDFAASLPKEYHVMTCVEYGNLAKMVDKSNHMRLKESNDVVDEYGNTLKFNLHIKNSGVISWMDDNCYIFAENENMMVSGRLCYFAWVITSGGKIAYPATCRFDTDDMESKNYIKIVRVKK